MGEDDRINNLRRRVQENPASIAFAQLAEALRLGGRPRDAVQLCRAGLPIYPEYLAARVTLARSFLDLNRQEEGEHELEQVRILSPGYLPALRALAEIHERRGGGGGPDAASHASSRASHDIDEFRRVTRLIETLESWLVAIYVTRAGRRP